MSLEYDLSVSRECLERVETGMLPASTLACPERRGVHIMAAICAYVDMLQMLRRLECRGIYIYCTIIC